MQKKIAAPSRFALAFHRWAIHRGFPALLWVAPRVSHPVLYRGARWIIDTVFAVHPKPLRDIERNLARVMGQPADSKAVRRTRRDMVHHLAYYWSDLFRFPQLPWDEVKASLGRGVGLERVTGALAAGKGAILLTGHLGNWELGGLFLRDLGLEVSVVYVPDAFEDAERFRSQLRRMCHVGEIPIRPGDAFASLPALRALREGKLIAVQGDRDFNDNGVLLDFFGAPAPFPRGPFLLSGLTGAPLLPSFVVYGEDGRFEIEVGEPITVGSGPDREAEILKAMRQWVAVLETAVRRWPNQWYTFFDYWAAGRAEAASAAPSGPAPAPQGTAGTSSPDGPQRPATGAAAR